MVLSAIVALSVIGAQVAVLLFVLRLVKSFGAFAESYRAATVALLSAHEASMTLHVDNRRILAELKRIHPSKERVA